MKPTKSENQVRRKALDIHEKILKVVRGDLEGWGNLVDELRVLGNIGAAMVDMAESELTMIKLQDDMKEKRRVVTAVH